MNLRAIYILTKTSPQPRCRWYFSRGTKPLKSRPPTIICISKSYLISNSHLLWPGSHKNYSAIPNILYMLQAQQPGEISPNSCTHIFFGKCRRKLSGVESGSRSQWIPNFQHLPTATSVDLKFVLGCFRRFWAQAWFRQFSRCVSFLFFVGGGGGGGLVSRWKNAVLWIPKFPKRCVFFDDLVESCLFLVVILPCHLTTQLWASWPNGAKW